MLKAHSPSTMAQAEFSALATPRALMLGPRDWGLAGGFLAVYLALEWMIAAHSWSASGLAPWNPQLGVGLAFVLLFGFRFLPAFVLGVLIAKLTMHSEPISPMYVIVEVVIVSVSYGFAAVLLAHLLQQAARIRSLADLMWMLAVASATPLVVGLLYHGALVNAGIVALPELPYLLRRYWIADSLGIVATLPVLFHCASGRGRKRIGAFLFSWKTMLQLGVMLLLLAMIFQFAEEGPIRYFFIMFIPLLWIAVRHGLLGAGLALVIFVLGVIGFLQLRAPDESVLFEIQLRVLALGITALILGVVVDERHRVQERLQQSMRLAAAGEMAAALAHELNQPLTALVSYGKACQLLLMKETSDKQALNETVDKVASQAQRIAITVSRLRDFLRSGRMSLEQVSVAELIASARADAACLPDADSVQIQVDISSGATAVYVDRTEIQIVLRNLLSNAIESICNANAQTRVVRVEATAVSSGLVRISVIDSGPGVSPEIRDRLFSPFETSKAHGMGMGLAVSRAIAEAHGGQLWAEPSSFGLFHLTLPTTLGDADVDGL